MLPPYFQPEDIEKRFDTKKHYLIADRIPLAIARTKVDPWCVVVKVIEVYGMRFYRFTARKPLLA